VQNYEAHLQTEENRDWDQSQGLGFKWWLGGFWVVLWVARARQLSHYFIHKHILIFPATQLPRPLAIFLISNFHRPQELNVCMSGGEMKLTNHFTYGHWGICFHLAPASL